MTATSASVRFGPDGVTGVESFIRLTGHTYIHCCLYDDNAPILTVRDAHVNISITVPGPGRGDRRRREVRPPAGRGGGPVRGRAGTPNVRWPPGCGSWRGWRRAGGVMAVLIEAGRLELVPPAAPGFSPPGKEEVTRVCAR